MTHGTEHGYNLHRRAGETPCDDCLDAGREAARRRQQAKRERLGSQPRRRTYDVAFGIVLAYCSEPGCPWREPCKTPDEAMRLHANHSQEMHDNHKPRHALQTAIRRARNRDAVDTLTE